MMKFYIFSARTEEISGDVGALMERMPRARRSRFEELKLPAQRLEYAASSLALERAAACLAPGKLASFRYDGAGRPCVDGLYVSLSHSAGLALCCAGHAPVGVDTERRDRCLSEAMLKKFGSLEDFMALEARVKMTGEGLASGLRAYRPGSGDAPVTRFFDIGDHRVCVCCAEEFEVEFV